eukprot:8072712-Pyramimonas_sp.AAC.1
MPTAARGTPLLPKSPSKRLLIRLGNLSCAREQGARLLASRWGRIHADFPAELAPLRELLSH